MQHMVAAPPPGPRRPGRPSAAPSAPRPVADGRTDDEDAQGPSRVAQFAKTKMCKFELIGLCAKGTECPFAHTKDELSPLPDLTCTKLCKMLISTGACNNPQCTYAHSKEELRATSTYHKTKMCRFLQIGHCALGSKCNFAHTPEELRSVDSPLTEGPRALYNASQVEMQGSVRQGSLQQGSFQQGSFQQWDSAAYPAPAGYLAAGGHPGQPQYWQSPSLAQPAPAPPVAPRAQNRAAQGRSGLPKGGGGKGGGKGGCKGAGAGQQNTPAQASRAGKGQPRRSGESSDAPAEARNAPVSGVPGLAEARDLIVESSSVAQEPFDPPPTAHTQGAVGSPPVAQPGSDMNLPFGNPLSRTSSGNALSSQDSPAYVMQTSSGLVAADFGAVGRPLPLRAVRSAGARLNHLGAEPGDVSGSLGELGVGLAAGFTTPREEILSGQAESFVRADPRQPKPQLHGDYMVSANEPSGTASVCSSQDGLGGSRGSSSIGWSAPSLSRNGLDVDLKEDVWQVKNTFLTFTPQAKPIRSVRTAEGALCNLGGLGVLSDGEES